MDFDMTLWMMLISVFSKKLEASFIAQVLSVMAMVVTGFCLFTLLTSNPFERLLINSCGAILIHFYKILGWWCIHQCFIWGTLVFC